MTRDDDNDDDDDNNNKHALQSTFGTKGFTVSLAATVGITNMILPRA